MAERLFVTRGYARTSLEAIIAESGLTRGAIYHHFDGKEALFAAVAEAISARAAIGIALAAQSATGIDDRLRAVCNAYLDAGLSPAVRQVLLVDAPAVLGWEKWRTIGTPQGLGFLEMLIQSAVANDAVADLPVRALAHALLGAINELNMSLAASDDKDRARLEAGLVVDRLLSGLRPRQPKSR
ncbi:MAG TPA: helix-turn-helix domain-containing protein [Candidatus Dormibacteraeota bacterium]|nr:helix-turn-helix domain-containing protein [Candidatus Dormibacteraeota bacterium]